MTTLADDLVADELWALIPSIVASLDPSFTWSVTVAGCP
jgi:hypothetical protein